MNQAHLHLFLVHFPIVGLILVTPLYFYGLIRKDMKILRLSLLLSVVLSLAGLGAYLTGEGAEEILEKLPSVEHELIEEHEEAAEWAFRFIIGTGFLSLLILAMKFSPAGKNRFYFGLLALLLLMSTIVSIRTGQLGGLIRHQEEISGTIPDGTTEP